MAMTSSLLPLGHLAQKLSEEGRTDDAILLLEHLTQIAPANAEFLRSLINLLAARNEAEVALEKLVSLDLLLRDSGGAVVEFVDLVNDAFRQCVDQIRAKDYEASDRLLANLLQLLPYGLPLLAAAVARYCAVEDLANATIFAKRVFALEPTNAEARVVLANHCRAEQDILGEIEHRLFLAAPEHGLDSEERSHNLYEIVNCVLSYPIDDFVVGQLEVARQQHRQLALQNAQSSSPSAWIAFHQDMLNALDMAALSQPLTGSPPDFPAGVDVRGNRRDFAAIKELAARLDTEAVFLVAADRLYVERYAGFFVRSVLRSTDIRSLIVVHVVGGVGHLPEIAAALGIDDERVILTGDDFDADQPTGRVCDAPTRGPISKPIAHYQSARFRYVGALLKGLGLPVFVSDIDCVLQRGVSDLLDQMAGMDFVLNQNKGIIQFAAQITANLLLFFPTPASDQFVGFLWRYLEKALAREVIPKWIDQIGLVMARHFVRSACPSVKIGYFDTDRDINNVVYGEYAPNDYRFLSLFQSFKLSSLPF